VPRLDLSRVWKLSADVGGADWLQIDLNVPSKSDATELLRGQWLPDQPLLAIPSLGSRLGDLVGTGWAGLYLASSTFQAALKRFSGWKTYAIDPVGTAERLKGFDGLAITGRFGPIDEIWEDPAISGRFGMYVDPETWDGSDVFIAGNRTGIYVIEAVADALAERELTNVVLEQELSLEAAP
jgi:hypothetical protein